jgi:hypothetical protein
LGTELNIFYRGPERFKEHIKVLVEDSSTVGSVRASIFEQLKAAGATPEEEVVRPSQAPTPQPTTSGAAQAQPAYLPQPQPQAPAYGAPTRVHQCGQPMRFFKAGVSKSTNRPYPAFFKCEQCRQTENA